MLYLFCHIRMNPITRKILHKDTVGAKISKFKINVRDTYLLLSGQVHQPRTLFELQINEIDTHSLYKILNHSQILCDNN